MQDGSILQHLVLRIAASVCGGDETLSRILDVPMAELRTWMEGKVAAPLPVIHQAMKLVNGVYRAADTT